ncbi:Cell surface protein [Oopsacas minuta]|uniref:Cell surface protein n=1 Tax=Oopsacas minuta TaxID=111878 RepID=A0AAV7JDY0_9METZ|nr:Cell surface protein [Oopsacas minuta]
MASLHHNIPEYSYFESEVLRAETEVESLFEKLIICLRNRKDILLNKLKELRGNYRRASINQRQFTTEIKQTIELVENIFPTEFLGDDGDSYDITEENSSQFNNNKQILFDFDTTLFEKIRNFGEITVSNICVSNLPSAKYKGKISPVISVGRIANSADGQFNSPWGVAIDYASNNMYIADHINGRVQVFDNEGRYKFKFGDKNGPGNMGLPTCIAISQRRVFVGQQSFGCLLVYDLDGNFINQIGSQGSGISELNDPRGLAIDVVTGDIYVCDHYNNRIQIFSEYAVSTFGHDTMVSPCAISLTKYSIFVLICRAPFILEFDKNKTLLYSEISNSVSRLIKFSYSFCIDGAGRFLVSDNNRGFVAILDSNGKLIHKIRQSISKPMGVTVDAGGNIVVVGFNHRLLIF